MRYLIPLICTTASSQTALAEGSRSIAGGLFGDLPMVLVLILAAALAMKWRDAARQEARADAATAQVIELQREAIAVAGQRAIQNKRAVDIMAQAISVQEQATQVISENTRHLHAVNDVLAFCSQHIERLERSAG